MGRSLAAGLAAALLVAVVTLAGGPAGADPELRLSPAAGPAGTPIVVSGSGFETAEIEIHWSSRTGPLLTTATGPEFSVTATVPEAVANSYQVVAVVRGENGVSTSSTSYQVLPPGGEAETTTTTPPPARDPVEGGTDGTTTTTAAVPAPSGRGRDADAPAPAARFNGLDGGLDPGEPRTTGDDGPALGMAGTVEPGGAGTARGGTTTGGGAGADAGLFGAFPPGVAGAEGAVTPTSGGAGVVPGPAGAPTGADTNLGGADGSGRALGSSPAAAQSGRVQSPILLFVGLGLLLAGGGVLAVRKHRGLDQ